MLIGPKLKVLRKNEGHSLRKLAELSDVTVGTLSQIENDKTSPSVGTLKRVLKALNMSMGEFFNSVENNEPMDQVIYSSADQVDVSPLKGLKLLAINGLSSIRKIQLFAETYEPHSSTGDEYYSHEGEECGICLEGEIELCVDGMVYHLEPGDMYYFDSQKQHRFTNSSDQPAKLISACSPSSF